MPIIDRQDATEVDEHISRVFAATTPSSRTDALRALFVEKLDFAPVSGHISLAARKAMDLPERAERIATMEGVTAVFVPLSIPDSDRVRKAEAAEAARLISNELAGDLLLIMTNRPATQIHFIYPTFEGATPYLRRLVVERDLPRRTAVQQLSNIYWNCSDTGSIHQALAKVFDVEVVTTEFFREYKRIFDLVMGRVQGFGPDTEETETKKLFVQTLFNRLMFVYFLSRKSWLRFGGDNDYLNALWKDYPAQSEDRNFYANRLQPLFFAGLNNPQSRNLSKDNPSLHALIGDVQFLNGGLFEELDVDKRAGIVIPDDAIEPILRELFDRFNFTVIESTPFDVEVAVDPEMLGKVFEELVTERHKTGAFYTPRPIVSFMCREVLKRYLQERAERLDETVLTSFVDNKDATGIDVATAREVAEALETVTVLDPACGSGAYLIGMMQELLELQTQLYSERLIQDPSSLYGLKLRVIQRNLFGADIDPFAINIAQLRLWLSLAIEHPGDVPEALPNLDFKIVCGDSLSSPDLAHSRQASLFDDRARGLNEQLDEAKRSFMTAVGAEKQSLRQRISELQEELADAIEDRSDEESVQWAVMFNEVFHRRGGFDIILANPPYDVIKSPRLRAIYQEGIFGRMNTYGLFIQRSLELMHDGSMLAFINPRTLLTDRYFVKLRQLLKRRSTLDEVVLIEDRHRTFARVLQAAFCCSSPERRLLPRIT